MQAGEPLVSDGPIMEATAIRIMRAVIAIVLKFRSALAVTPHPHEIVYQGHVTARRE
jgi:hypothetical protein